MKTLNLLLLTLLLSVGASSQELISGTATLTKVKDGIYEIKVQDGAPKLIDIRPNAEAYAQGTLSVLFKDCEALRQSVFKIGEITEQKLIATVNDYNNCSLSPFQPTQKEVDYATNFQGDRYKLFATVGVSMNLTSFLDYEDYENQVQSQIGFGIAATPGFLGSLQGNLYFTLEVDAAISGEKKFSNSPLVTNLKKNSYKIHLGSEYHFNKNGSTQPLIGFGVGLTRDQYKGRYDVYNIKRTAGGVFFIPKAGILFSLDEKKSLGVILSYIPKYENNLSLLNQDNEEVPLIIDTYNFNAGVYLYF